MLTLRSPSGFPALGESALDFTAAITLIRHATIIIPTGITCGRTTLIPSHIRIITVATDTPGMGGVELTTATIVIIITTTIELISLGKLWE